MCINLLFVYPPTCLCPTVTALSYDCEWDYHRALFSESSREVIIKHAFWSLCWTVISWKILITLLLNVALHCILVVGCIFFPSSCSCSKNTERFTSEGKQFVYKGAGRVRDMNYEDDNTLSTFYYITKL